MQIIIVFNHQDDHLSIKWRMIKNAKHFYLNFSFCCSFYLNGFIWVFSYTFRLWFNTICFAIKGGMFFANLVWKMCWQLGGLKQFDEKSFYFGVKELQFGNQFWTMPIPQPKIASQVTSDVKWAFIHVSNIIIWMIFTHLNEMLIALFVHFPIATCSELSSW